MRIFRFVREPQPQTSCTMKTNLASFGKLGTVVPGLVSLLSCVSLVISTSQSQATMPPNPIVEMRFEEGAGNTTTNGGTMGGTATFYDLQVSGFPVFTINVPIGAYTPTNNSYSVDF